MDGPTILGAIRLFVALLGVAAIVAIVARPIRLPYSVALVLVGLLAGAGATLVGLGEPPRIAPEIVLAVLLPGLVFEAAYRLEIGQLRRSAGSLALLAVPGVVISAAVVALFLNVATGLRLDLAFIVGAMVSATDPVAVVSTFRRLRVPPGLATVVEGESLLNDGTGLVIFAIALQALAQPVGPVEALVTFAASISISALIGLATGFLAARLMSLVDDHLVELTISLVLAYGTYLLADAIHASGIIATVVAAVVLGNYGRPRTISQPGIDALDTVWEFLAYLLTAIVFLLVGLAIPPARLLDSAVWIGWGVVGALVGRAIVVYVMLRLAVRWLPLDGSPAALPPGWYHVLFWSGLRGAVAVAAALALPVDVPQRDLLQGVTFGIVLFTLLVQGTTAGLVVRRSVAATETESEP
ncbi:MAG: cation:proton antiporter [Chloroflexota bacterium]